MVLNPFVIPDAKSLRATQPTLILGRGRSLGEWRQCVNDQLLLQQVAKTLPNCCSQKAITLVVVVESSQHFIAKLGEQSTSRLGDAKVNLLEKLGEKFRRLLTTATTSAADDF